MSPGASRVLLLAGLIVLSGCLSPDTALYPDGSLREPTPIPQVCTPTQCFSVALADTQALREQGLMFRKDLDADKGMLFIFLLEDRHTFWMKNTLIPLDIVWISRSKEIVDIRTAQPCAKDPCEIYGPQGSALYVLEINAGAAEQAGMKVGMPLEFKAIES